MAAIIRDSAWRDIAIHQTALISLRREWDKTVLFCSRIHARDVRPAGALFLFRVLRGLADPASGFRQSSALIAPVKNCIHPSTAQRILLLMTRDTTESLFLQRFFVFCNFVQSLATQCQSLFLVFLLSISCMYACTSFLHLFYLHHRCRLFILFVSLSFSFPPIARRVALFARTVFPFRLDHIHHPATKSRHLLRSSSSDSMTTVVPFNIDEGVVVAGPTRRCFTMYILTCQHSISCYLW